MSVSLSHDQRRVNGVNGAHGFASFGIGKLEVQKFSETRATGRYFPATSGTGRKMISRDDNDGRFTVYNTLLETNMKIPDTHKKISIDDGF